MERILLEKNKCGCTWVVTQRRRRRNDEHY